jgi:hypothetical protein
MLRSLHRKLDRLQSAFADRWPSPASGPADDTHLLLWAAALGERGTLAEDAGLPGFPADWSPFFTVWATFAAISDAWQARGDVPPDDFGLADAPAVVRLRAWHLAGANQRGGRPQPSQLSKITLLVLHALDLPFGREDRERLAERATMPPEVLQVFLDDPEATPTHDCVACGVFLPVTPGALAIASAKVYYATCPLCGGRVGADLFRWHERMAASAAAVRGRHFVQPADEVEAKTGQHDDTIAGRQADARAARRPVDVGRRIVRDDDVQTDFGLAAGRPRRPLF